MIRQSQQVILLTINCIYYTLHTGLNKMHFTWDEVKNRKNFIKHGVWFEEACTVFADLQAIEIFDPTHSADEERFILLGFSTAPRLLVVVYCEKKEHQVRIISSRKASTKEMQNYEKRIRFQQG